MKYTYCIRTMTGIVALAAIICMAASVRAVAAPASWTGSAGNGLWADNGNWTADYPNGTDHTATFTNTVDIAVEINEAITVGDILHGTPSGGGNAAGNITFNGTGSLNFDTASGDASILSLQNSAYDPSYWVGPYTINVPIGLDVDTFTIGAAVEVIGQMTAVAGRDVTVNVNVRDNQTWSTSNYFGNGILNISTVGTFLTLVGVDSVGGPNVTVRVLGGRCDLTSTTSKMADVEIVGSAQISPNNVVIGSLNIYSGKTWQILSAGADTTLRIAPDETVFIDTDALLYREHFGGFRRGFVRVSTNTTVTGFGTIATLPSGTVAPHVYLEAGATLNPGTNGVTGIFHIGSGTYTNTEVTLEPGAVMAFDLGGTVAGTNYDQVSVDGGTLTITNAVLNIASVTTSYALSDKVFLVVENGGAIAGNFAGLADGDTVEFITQGSTYTATINYTGNAGGDSVTGGDDIVLSSIFTPLKGTVITIH